jgi:hypothetical protein
MSFTAEPAMQPDLVQLGLSRLPFPFDGPERERPCGVYAARGGQLGLLARVSTERIPNAKQLVKTRTERFNCEELPNEGESPYVQPAVLRYPRKLHGTSPVKQICDASARTSAPLLRLVNREIRVGTNPAITGAWAAERLAETIEDAVLAIGRQPANALGRRLRVYSRVGGRLAESYRTLAVALVSPGGRRRRRDIRSAIGPLNHRAADWYRLGNQSGAKRC